MEASMADRRVALITGGGRRRLGNFVARYLAENGFSIALHYHSSGSDALATVAELSAKGTDAVAIRADVSLEADVQSLSDQVLKRFGRVDVLLNTAAIWMATPLEQVTAESVRRHFEVNTLGTFLCSQRLGLEMVKQPQGGCIITMGDWAIERPYRNYASYFPSKGAIPAMTRSLAVELGTRNPRVRVNCIHPGPVLLPPDMPASEREQVIEQTLVKREGNAGNIAQAVGFFIENEFVTGTCITVDGGRTVYAGEANA
jgi:pteridine reductase